MNFASNSHRPVRVIAEDRGSPCCDQWPIGQHIHKCAVLECEGRVEAVHINGTAVDSLKREAQITRVRAERHAEVSEFARLKKCRGVLEQNDIVLADAATHSHKDRICITTWSHKRYLLEMHVVTKLHPYEC